MIKIGDVFFNLEPGVERIGLSVPTIQGVLSLSIFHSFFLMKNSLVQ
jgi:hypothetical protein